MASEEAGGADHEDEAGLGDGEIDEFEEFDGMEDLIIDVAPDEAGEPALDVLRVRRRHGVGAAVLAGALFGIRDVLESPKDPSPVVVQAQGEPGDIDRDGIEVPVDDTKKAVAPPLAPVEPSLPRRRRRSRSSARRSRS
jgi:hypothetical protein